MQILLNQIKTLETDLDYIKISEDINIALKMKRIRLNMGLTQKELATKMGVKQTVISRIECLDGGITSSTISKFCEATNLEFGFIEKPKTLTIFEIANYILQKGHEILGENYDITNLKLNKLLFYIEKDLIETLKERHFNFTAQAWQYGPVYPDLYHRYKHFGYNPIIETAENINLPAEITNIINTSLNKNIKLSAEILKENSHLEPEWYNVYIKDCNVGIKFASPEDKFPLNF